MKLKRSACIETLYTELPFLDRIAAAAGDGFHAFEFWGWEDKDLQAIRSAAEAAGIVISGFNGDAELSLIDPATRDQYLAFLERSAATARDLGALSVTIHSNGLGEGGVVIEHYASLPSEVKWVTLYRNLEKCAEIADRYAINMNLEALNIVSDHVGNFLVNTDAAAAVCRLLAHPRIKILYDAYHMQLNEGNLFNTVRANIDQIGHIHIADAPGRNEPGTGEINFANFYRLLEELNYEGLVGYELFPQSTTEKAVQAIFAQA